ncbi:MAG: hypothetical protein JSW64_09115 [Candidatus Zixiibacteriota bacterium]|nr:MAG: hypothetical protein JSW64_09115 [candidate division Zixibacteria bacterium]
MAIWTIIFGIFTLAILLAQYLLQRSNFRLALYDKRYAVFLSAMEYISKIVQSARVEDDELMKLLRNSKDKEFLFGSEVGDYIQSLYSHGVDLEKVRSLLDVEKNQTQRERLVTQQTELFRWFKNQFEEGKRCFEPYLAIRSK